MPRPRGWPPRSWVALRRGARRAALGPGAPVAACACTPARRCAARVGFGMGGRAPAGAAGGGASPGGGGQRRRHRRWTVMGVALWTTCCFPISLPAAVAEVPNGARVQPERATLHDVPPGLVAPRATVWACRCCHCRLPLRRWPPPLRPVAASGAVHLQQRTPPAGSYPHSPLHPPTFPCGTTVAAGCCAAGPPGLRFRVRTCVCLRACRRQRSFMHRRLAGRVARGRLAVARRRSPVRGGRGAVIGISASAATVATEWGGPRWLPLPQNVCGRRGRGLLRPEAGARRRGGRGEPVRLAVGPLCR